MFAQYLVNKCLCHNGAFALIANDSDSIVTRTSYQKASQLAIDVCVSTGNWTGQLRSGEFEREHFGFQVNPARRAESAWCSVGVGDPVAGHDQGQGIAA